MLPEKITTAFLLFWNVKDDDPQPAIRLTFLHQFL